jgi:hypothetical protein
VLSVAVIVGVPAVVELVIVAVYVPSWLSVVPPTISPASLEENETLSPAIGWPSASVTVAVALDVDVPLAMIEVGTRTSPTFDAGPTVCVSGACPEPPVVSSVAVIVASPTVVELLIVAVYVPLRLSVVPLTMSPASLEVNVIVSPITGLLSESITVAVAVVVDAPSATIVLCDSCTETVDGSANAGAAAHRLAAVATTATAKHREKSLLTTRVEKPAALLPTNRNIKPLASENPR